MISVPGSAPWISSARNTALSASPQCASSTKITSGRIRASRASSARSAANPRRRISCGSCGTVACAASSANLGTRRSTGNNRTSEPMSRGASCSATRSGSPTIAPVSESTTPSSILNGTASRS